MATTSFNTRISLKYDTYANWIANDPLLFAGEVALVVIPAATGAVTQEPAVLIKVGDGKQKFKQLPFVSGTAADVHNWAKEANKPTYTANEITGLSEFISGEIEDTDTRYKLEQDGDDPHILKLYSQAKDGGSSWKEEASITTADTIYDDKKLSGQVSSLEKLVGSTSVTSQIATAISALKDGSTIDSFGDVETALETYATKTEAQDYADAKDAAIAEAKKAGTDAQSAVDTLKTTVNKKADKATSLSGYGIKDAYTKTEADTAIANAVGSAGHLKRSVVESVPNAEGADKDTIYMVKDPDVSSGDAYKEYMLIEGAIVQIGDTSVDLSRYAKTKDVESKISTAKTEAATDATTKANSAETKAKAYADGLKNTLSEEIEGISTQLATKANSTDLAAIAKSGDVSDLKQKSGYITLNCGSATVNI